MRRLLLLALAGLAVAGASTPVAASRMQAAPRLAVSSSQFGKILFDGRRRAIYAFTRDGRGKSACYGACASAWPPFLVARRPVAGTGVRRALIGTVRRRDGRLQATYAGRPLYFYVGDRRPGQVLCQNADEYGGTWLVVRGSGRLVRG
jgi:predicted lipoprotein with Yx(FWY)xxD motif